MRSFTVVFIAALAIAASAQNIDECLQQDSISCVQKSLYRKAREFFDKDNLELVSGVSLVKAKDGRSARSGKNVVYEQEIEKAENVAERQNALENFVGDEVSDFFYGRSLRINFAPVFEKISESARAIGDSIPAEVKQAADEVAEGRGKKKMIKKILPLLLLAKAKIGALATLAFFALALIAKKAIIVSLISIALSAFVGLRGIFSGKSGIASKFSGAGFGYGHDGIAYNSAGSFSSASGSSGWSAGAPSSWDDGHNYAAQSQAFSGYH